MAGSLRLSDNQRLLQAFTEDVFILFYFILFYFVFIFNLLVYIAEMFSWDDLRKILPRCQVMGKVPNGVETWRKF